MLRDLTYSGHDVNFKQIYLKTQEKYTDSQEIKTHKNQTIIMKYRLRIFYALGFENPKSQICNFRYFPEIYLDISLHIQMCL